jgi:hypothetical protein
MSNNLSDALVHDLAQDLKNAGWFCDKVCATESYAQNLYAAMCNMRFQRQEVFPILSNELWHCSWRCSGGIVSEIRNEGSYMDWYCSGIGEGLGNGDPDGTRGYVSEGTVTDEIRADLLRLGWVPVPWPDDEL